MLPFLKPKTVAGLIISKRKPDGSKDTMPESTDGEENQELESCAQEILRAIEAKDARSLAMAIKDAFELCEKYPHSEGPHTNEQESE